MGNSGPVDEITKEKDRVKAEIRKDFNIPHSYGDNKIVLMVRDPWTLYSYWEIAKDVETRVKQDMLDRGLAVLKSILRIYDVTEGTDNLDSRVFVDFELKNWANNWYVHTGNPGRKWIASVGILSVTGEFFLLAKSNMVEAPAYGMSDVYDEKWMCTEEEYYKMFAVAGGYGVGTSSLEMREIMQRHLRGWLSSGGVTSGMFGGASFAERRDAQQETGQGTRKQ